MGLLKKVERIHLKNCIEDKRSVKTPSQKADRSPSRASPESGAFASVVAPENTRNVAPRIVEERKFMGSSFGTPDYSKVSILNLCVEPGNFVIPESPRMFEMDSSPNNSITTPI